MNVTGLALGPMGIIILAIAAAFLFSLMGKRGCSKGGGIKVLGVLMVFFAIFAFFTMRSHSRNEGPVISHEGFVNWESSHEVEGPAISPSISPFVFAEDGFARSNAQDVVRCNAVFLPPNAEGMTEVRVELDLDPEWKVFALGQARGRGRAQTISQLVLAEADSKYKQVDKPEPSEQPAVDGVYRFHSNKVIWSTPIRLKRGVEPGSLQVHGVIQAQLMKDDVIVPVDRNFVATLDHSGLAFTSGDGAIGMTASQSAHDQDQSVSANSSSSSNSNTNSDHGEVSAGDASASTASAPPAASEYGRSRTASPYMEYPFGDPEFDAESDAEMPGKWIKTAPEVRSRDGVAIYTTIATKPYKNTNYDEMNEEFQGKVMDRFNAYIDHELLEKGASARLNLQYPQVRDLLSISNFYEPGDPEIDPVGAEMQTMYGRLAFTPELNQQVKAMYKDAVIVHRIGFFGAIGGMILAFVGAIYGYFRLDTATKGYYSGWLKVGAFVVCVLILAAGGGILEEFGRRGGF